MKQVLILAWVLLLAGITDAQTTAFSSTEGVAIKGYDPVAYFIQSKAVAGSSDFTYEWSGSTWRFASAANRDTFKINPEKYAPQYGGFCAYGCSENHKSPTDPEAWTIIDGKLYLNYSRKVKEWWIKDAAARIKTADALWPALNN